MVVRIITADWIAGMRSLDDASVQLIVTSPPYFALRHYGVDGQIGSEATPDEFVRVLVEGFREARRVLRDDGVMCINLGDSYSGSGKGPTGHNGIQNAEKRQGFESGYLRENGEWSRGGRKNKNEGIGGIPPKNLLMIPFRVALALQADGWILRSVIPWVKRNCMPESVTDRPTSAIEYLFLLSKRSRYFWDGEAVRQPNTLGTLRRFETNMAYSGAGGKTAEPGGGIKNNSSYKAALTDGYVPGGRAFRNSDPFLATWQGLWCDAAGDPLALLVNPQGLKEAHYASFPARLVEPFIRAGTSERGACAACGAPWVRVVERRFRPQEDVKTPSRLAKASNKGLDMSNGWGDVPRGSIDSATLGWQPSCRCGTDETKPCVVLDCFGGSGTVGLVADRLGRDAVLIELNPEYAEIARRRIDSETPLFGESVTVDGPAFDAPSLFDAMEAALIDRITAERSGS